MSLKAVAHISQVRGGSQARIMLADDGKKFVVKLQGTHNAPGCWLMTTWLVGWLG